MLQRRLVALHIGKPESILLPDGKRFRTSLYKTSVCETVWLGAENLEGNAQANLKYHGGPDKAVCVYPVEHLSPLSELLGQQLPHGAMGENFTGENMLEGEVCLGDQYRVGDAIVEISQPRQPCNSLVKRWGSKELPKLMVQHGWTGFYGRVIEEGMVQPGDGIQLLERPLPTWSISVLNKLLLARGKDQRGLAEVVLLPQLAADWRTIFQSQLP